MTIISHYIKGNNMKKWYKKWFKDPYTIYCERTPFLTEFTRIPVVYHVNGLLNAESKMLNWVHNHPWGKAWILRGFQMVYDESNVT